MPPLGGKQPAEAGTTDGDVHVFRRRPVFPSLGLARLPCRRPPPGLLGGAWQATADFFQVGGMPFSYLVGSVIFATALWITSWITVPQPDRYFAADAAANSRGLTARKNGPERNRRKPRHQTAAGRPDHRHGRLPLGRPRRRPAGAAVPLGGKYALASGLMEISYNTGAKVILQGPCTYEVDSARGGFLSLGKLTAQSGERRGEGGRRMHTANPANPKSTIRNPSPLSPLLSPVRRPHSHRHRHRPGHGVRRGSHAGGRHGCPGVPGRDPGSDRRGQGQPSPRRVCREGEAVRVGAGEPVIRTIARKKNTAHRRSSAPCRRRTPCATAKLTPNSCCRLTRRSTTAWSSPAARKTALLFSIPLPAATTASCGLGDESGGRPTCPAASATRFGFRGPEAGDRVIVPDYPKTTNGRLTVAAWVMATGRPEWAMIAGNWGCPTRRARTPDSFILASKTTGTCPLA